MKIQDNNIVKIKPSRFNIKIPLSEKSFLLFNCLYFSFLKLDKKQILEAEGVFKKPTLHKNKISALEKRLIQTRMIIAKKLDELQILKNSYKKAQEDNSSFSLTICPTLNCNFKCYYCIGQGRIKQTMSKKTENLLFDFVKEKIKGKKRFNVTWYGGEPLLRKDIILRLSSKFIELAKINNCSYNAILITNGTLLTKEFIEQLLKIKINSMQITLDGPASVHNQRRIFNNGKGSFDLILNNLKLLKGRYKGRINIRVNIDRNNNDINTLISVVRILRDNKLLSMVSYIGIGVIAANTKACQSITSLCISDKIYSNLEKEFTEYLYKRGLFRLISQPSKKYIPCCAVNPQSIGIDSSGRLYKCWEDVGLPDKSFGSLREKISNNAELEKWLKYSPLLNKKCRSCSFLPLCMGFCPREDIERFIKHKRCPEIKYNYQTKIKNYYLLMMLKFLPSQPNLLSPSC